MPNKPLLLFLMQLFHFKIIQLLILIAEFVPLPRAQIYFPQILTTTKFLSRVRWSSIVHR